MVTGTPKLEMKILERMLGDYTESMLRWKWVNTYSWSMQLLASPWQTAERLIPKPPCPAAGSMAHSDLLLLFHMRTCTLSAHQYYISKGQEAGDSMELTLYLTPYTPIHFLVDLIRALVVFCPLLLLFSHYRWSLSCLLDFNHLFQLQLNGWRDRDAEPVFMRELPESTSLWLCNRNTGFLT